MKTKIIQPVLKTAFVAVIAVLGASFAAHAAHAAGTVSFSQDSNGTVTCRSSSGSQTGSDSCTGAVDNTNASGGETLTWTSVSVSYSPSGSWLSVSPTQSSSPIAPGSSAQVTYTVPTNLAAGTYNATVTFNGQSNAPSGGVSVPSDTANVQFTVAANNPPPQNNPPGAPGSLSDQNTNSNSSIACDSIQLSWSAGQNADSYDVFRNGTQILSHYSGLSYTDTGVTSGVSYSYTIDGYSASLGTSAAVSFAPASIQASACQVDLSLSDDLINTVNQQAYPFNSSCVGSQSGTATVIQQSELVELRLDICNRGSAAALNTVLSTNFDYTTNHTEYTSPWPGQTSPSSTSPSGNGENVSWNLGTINPNSNTTVYVYLYPYAGQNVSQTLQRFINSADITYTSAAGNTGAVGCIGNYANSSTPCVVSTGYVPFTATTTSSASQQEIQP